MSSAAEVHEICDILRSDEAKSMSIDWLVQANHLLSQAYIEISERESPSPGVPGPGNYGASPKQLELQREFFTRKWRLIAAYGANRSGKTQALWGMCFCKHIRDFANDGDLYWCIAPDFTKLRQGPHKWLWQFLPRAMFGKRQFTAKLGFGTNPVLDLELPGNRGRCTVVFKTEEQDIISFESDSVTGVAWTEATREVILDALLPRVADQRGWILMDYVPYMGWHKFRLKLTSEPTWLTQNFCMADNGHNMPEGEIEYQRRSMPPDIAAVRIDGKDGAEFGAVYKEFLPDIHVVHPFQIPKYLHRDNPQIPVTPEDPDAMLVPRYRCYDWGYRNPSACLWAALLPAGFKMPDDAGEVWAGREIEYDTLVVYQELYGSELNIPKQAQMIKDLSEGDTYAGYGIICDPTVFNRSQFGEWEDAKSIGQLFAEHGVKMTPGKRTSGIGEQSMVSKVRLWFAHNRILFFGPPKDGRCSNAIREHQSWRYKENRDGNAPGNEPFEDKDNHTADALKYLVAEPLTFFQPEAHVDYTAPPE